MFYNFDFYKAKNFLKRTHQSEYIIKAVDSLLPYHELDILDMIEHIQLCHYFMIEKLYCIIIQEMDYNVPFIIIELYECIRNYPKRKYKGYNQKAYEYVENLYHKLLRLYPC